MMSVEEMKNLLAQEYGINSAEELNEALLKTGGVNISVFTQTVFE